MTSPFYVHWGWWDDGAVGWVVVDVVEAMGVVVVVVEVLVVVDRCCWIGWWWW